MLRVHELHLNKMDKMDYVGTKWIRAYQNLLYGFDELRGYMMDYMDYVVKN